MTWSAPLLDTTGPRLELLSDEPIVAHGGDSHNQQDHAGGGGGGSVGGFSFLSTAAVEDMHRDMVDDEPWTLAQHAALKAYAGSAYEDVNGLLRGAFTEDQVDDRTKSWIDDIGGAMRLTTRDLRVGRSVAPDAFGLDQATEIDADYTPQLGTLVGKIVREPGFLSTSTAEYYINADWGPDRITLEIDVPAGTRAAYMASPNDPLEMPGLQPEQELLLDLGARLEIVSVSKTPGKPTRVLARVVNT